MRAPAANTVRSTSEVRHCAGAGEDTSVAIAQGRQLLQSPGEGTLPLSCMLADAGSCRCA